MTACDKCAVRLSSSVDHSASKSPSWGRLSTISRAKGASVGGGGGNRDLGRRPATRRRRIEPRLEEVARAHLVVELEDDPLRPVLPVGRLLLAPDDRGGRRPRPVHSGSGTDAPRPAGRGWMDTHTHGRTCVDRWTNRATPNILMGWCPLLGEASSVADQIDRRRLPEVRDRVTSMARAVVRRPKLSS